MFDERFSGFRLRGSDANTGCEREVGLQLGRNLADKLDTGNHQQACHRNCEFCLTLGDSSFQLRDRDPDAGHWKAISTQPLKNQRNGLLGQPYSPVSRTRQDHYPHLRFQ